MTRRRSQHHTRARARAMASCRHVALGCDAPADLTSFLARLRRGGEQSCGGSSETRAHAVRAQGSRIHAHGGLRHEEGAALIVLAHLDHIWITAMLPSACGEEASRSGLGAAARHQDGAVRSPRHRWKALHERFPAAAAPRAMRVVGAVHLRGAESPSHEYTACTNSIFLFTQYGTTILE